MLRIASATSADERHSTCTSSSGRRRWSSRTTRLSSRRTISSGRRSTAPPAKRGLMWPGLRALVPRSQVLRLLLGELVDLDAHGLELEAGDLTIDVLRHDVDLRLELIGVRHDELCRKGLVGEAHVHDGRRVPLGGAEGDEAAG